MALDIDAELKKAKEKTDVYKTYKEYKEGYDELKKKVVIHKKNQMIYYRNL